MWLDLMLICEECLKLKTFIYALLTITLILRLVSATDPVFPSLADSVKSYPCEDS